MIVDSLVAAALEIPAEREAFHFTEKGWMIGQHIFEGAVFIACFPHENTAGFLDDFRFNYPRRISEKVQVGSTANDSIYRFAVATRTHGKGFTWNTGSHRHSLSASEQWAGCPTWLRHLALREG